MKGNIGILATVTVFAVLMAAPARGQQPAPPADHEQHHPAVAATAPEPAATQASMMAAQAKLQELVKKMNAAKGEAKTVAMAELLTAIVEHHTAMCGPMMANMKSMMDKMEMMKTMGGAGQLHDPAAPPKQ